MLFGITVMTATAQNLDAFKYNGSFQPEQNKVTSQFQFNGYTNHWHDIYREQIRYGNLFKMVVPRMDYTITQNKVDLATELGIPGLAVQEGFLYNLYKDKYSMLDQPKIGRASCRGRV